MTAAAAAARNMVHGPGPARTLGTLVSGPAAVLAAGLEPAFLAEVGWDPSARVIAPPPGHRLLQDVGAGRGYARGWDVSGCAVGGCGRHVTGAGRMLCRDHRRQQQVAGKLPLEQFLALPQAGPLAATGECQVPACPRDRTSRGRYCEAHQHQLRMARLCGTGSFDEERWRATASPVPVGEQVSLRGLPVLLAAEILYGLQQRTRAGFTIRLHVLRALVEDLRQTGAVSILQVTVPDLGPMEREKRAILGSLSRYVRGGLGDTRAEIAKDVWDLSAFGASRGKLSFTAISQGWLRQAAKRWAADDLPCRRGTCPHARVQHIINAAAVGASARRPRQPRRAARPARPSDIEAFLQRLAYLESAGQISQDLRVRICQDLRRILDRFRALGLSRPAGLRARTRFRADNRYVPAAPEPPEPCRDLPPEIMQALAAGLADLERGSCGPEIRAGVELLIDTGRRPEEIWPSAAWPTTLTAHQR